MKMKLYWQILIAIFIAFLVGLFSMNGLDKSWFGFSLIPAFKFLGDIFLNALKMVVVPLIAASIISSIAGQKNTSGLARLGGKTILFYVSTSFLAILVGLVSVNLIKPGIIDGQAARHAMKMDIKNTEKLEETIAKSDAGKVRDVIVNAIPSNIVKSASNNGAMLSIIVFCIFFAVFMTKIKERYYEIQLGFWQGLFEIMILITQFIMKFAPIGVFGLVAGSIAVLDSAQIDKYFQVILWFFLTVFIALAVHACVTIPLILKYVAKVNPIYHFRAMRNALVTAFSTSSSSATLPVTLECVEEKAKVSKSTSSFVLPLGATVNMDGTALYECVAVIFLAQMVGIEIGIGMQFMIVALALLTSIGVAGVPSASIVAIVIITNFVDPSGAMLALLGIILVVDRPLDMMRTSVNVLSDSTAAVTIGKSEGEDNILKEKPS